MGLVFFCGAMLVLMLYFAAFYQNPPARFFNTPFPVEPKVAPAGGQISVAVEACKYTEAPVAVYATWTNELIFQQPPASFAGLPLGCATTDVLINIPAELPPGSYILRYRFVYNVSPLSFARIVEAETERFTITEP